VTDLALMTSTALLVVRRPALLWQHPAWDLTTPAGAPLGTVLRRPGSAVSYAVTDPAGTVVWVVEQQRSGRLSRFVVTDGNGTPVGEVEQENALFSPHLRLVDPEGAAIRLDSDGKRSGPWAVQDLAGQPLGSVVLQPPARDALPLRRYLVSRGDGLGGELWPLALVSAICLDLVQDHK
jgi:hypothetical protein